MNRQEITVLIKKVSNCMMHLDEQGQKEKFPVSLLDMNCWEWPQGVGINGLIHYAIAENDEDILAFVEKWYDDHMSKVRQIEHNVNSTSPMIGLTYLYEIRPKPEYAEAIREWADWVMDHSGLIRTGDGCMQHMITGDPNKDQILIDTLYMTVLFLLRAGKQLNRPDMIDEANYQIMTHIKYLFDVRCGLFYHGWTFEGMHHYGAVHWLRGNCWYAVGCSDFIFEQPELPVAIRRFYETTLVRQAEAVKRYQDPELKLWHTVIDEPKSYIEISGSAGFLFGIMKCVRAGLLPETAYLGLIRDGFKAILGYIDEDGGVRNVSYGTPIGSDKQFYMDIPCFRMTYGQAMMILVLQEALEDYWAQRLLG